MEDQNTDESFLENADINADVLTLQELCKRRKLLLEKKKQILDLQNKATSQLGRETPSSAKLQELERQAEDLTSEFVTLTTVFDPVQTVCELKATTYASCFVDYLTKLLNDSPKDVVIFTDGCTAQNRNNVVSNALLRLAMDKNIVIIQKYLEKGHTQMEVDSVHSVIETKLKNREIFLPSQYATITKEARTKPSPYRVITPDYMFFRDFSIKDYQIYESIRPGRGAGDHCVADIKALGYNPNGTIDFKLHFNDDFIPLPRRPKKVSSLIESLPQLYESKQAISKTKYDHLQRLKRVVPKDCHSFYDNLPYK